MSEAIASAEMRNTQAGPSDRRTPWIRRDMPGKVPDHERCNADDDQRHFRRLAETEGDEQYRQQRDRRDDRDPRYQRAEGRSYRGKHAKHEAHEQRRQRRYAKAD